MARPITTDEWCALVRLERWRAEIDVVLRFLADRSALSGADAESARDRYSFVKVGLRREIEAGAKLRGYEELSDVERCWYQPAIRLAYCALQSKLNTKPGTAWRDELLIARRTLSDALDQLRASASLDSYDGVPRQRTVMTGDAV